MAEAPQADAARNPPRRRPRGRVLLLGLLLFIVAGMAVLWLLGSAEPAYWRPVDADDPAVAETAERLEAAVGSEVTRVRPEAGPWRLDLDTERVNRWLAARLPKWLANRGVDRRVLERFEHPMVAVVDGRIEVAARVDAAGRSVVARLRYRPELEQGQHVRLRLEAARIGRLSVPLKLAEMAWADERLGLDGEQRQQVESLWRELETIDLVLPLSDGRRVSVVGMRLSEGAISLTCRTMRTAP